MKNWVIISTYSPKIGDLYELTMPNKEAYAKRHDYGLEVVHFEDTEKGYGEGYFKLIHRVGNLLREGVGVLQMDADAVFTNPHIRIDEIAWPTDAVMVAREPAGRCEMNGGVVILMPNVRSVAYVEKLIEVYDEWKDDPLVPQGWIYRNLFDPVMRSALRIVPPALMNAIPCLDPKYPQDDPTEVWQPSDWICHAYGFPIERKVELLRKVMA